MSEELILQKLNNIEEKVTSISEIVSGNGDPQKGMVVRQAKMEEWKDNHEANHKISKRGRVAIACSSIMAVSAIIVAFISLLK